MSKFYQDFLVSPLIFAIALGLLFPVKAPAALIDLGLGTSYDSSTSVDMGATSSASTGAGIDENASTEIRINRDNVEVEGEGESTVSIMPRAVLTNSDLQAYAAGAVRSDAGVEEMNFTKDVVEVTYKQKGRFLALFPVTFAVTARAHADGAVELDYPWYAFLTIDRQNEIETNVKIAVDTALRERMVGSVRAEGEPVNPEFSAAESATIASQMHAVLKSSFENEGVAEPSS